MAELFDPNSIRTPRSRRVARNIRDLGADRRRRIKTECTQRRSSGDSTDQGGGQSSEQSGDQGQHSNADAPPGDEDPHERAAPHAFSIRQQPPPTVPANGGQMGGHLEYHRRSAGAPRSPQNNFYQSSNLRPTAPFLDPFGFMDRLPREYWETATCRFHLGVRRASALPAEIVALVGRDPQSAFADQERVSPDHPLSAREGDALGSLAEALKCFPDEAATPAAHTRYTAHPMLDFGAFRGGHSR